MLVIFSFTYTTWFYFYKYLLQIKSSLICFCSFLFVKYIWNIFIRDGTLKSVNRLLGPIFYWFNLVRNVN